MIENYFRKMSFSDRAAELDYLTIVAISFSCVVFLIIVLAFLIYRRMRAQAMLMNQWWRVSFSEVKINSHSTPFHSASRVDVDRDSTRSTIYQTTGWYKGAKVHITKLRLHNLVVDRRLLKELKQMREITCTNLVRLIGLCDDQGNVCIVTEHCTRGSLQDILHNESIQLDWDFRISLISDMVEGMNYLHSSPIGVHGRLTSVRCVIDSRFVLKLAGYGLHSLTEANSHCDRKDSKSLSSSRELLWMAPEHIRHYPPRHSSQAGDVYSFGIILYEMCTRCEPYVNETWYTSAEDALQRIQDSKLEPVRPTLPQEDSCTDIAELARNCWQEIPTQRPTFVKIRKIVRFMKRRRNINPSENVLDLLLKRMEQYANNLEGLVEERTKAFLEEKKKSEELLYQVLPKSVANQLRVGTTVYPEAFDSVTVYFSDIVGFTSISAESSPFEVVDLLNDLYTCFDTIIDNFDVYKVETIGDAYMVVSGLPDRNGNEHARQIAWMSLKILCSVRLFTIRHMPETPLQARIGIHSGSVCAGVVGLKMPRYCLFGDTVNTANRMESNGEPMKIHISDQTKELLDSFNCFVIKERGLIDIKGKGMARTFWLEDEIC